MEEFYDGQFIKKEDSALFIKYLAMLRARAMLKDIIEEAEGLLKKRITDGGWSPLTKIIIKDVKKLTQEEWDALPEEVRQEIARMMQNDIEK